MRFFLRACVRLYLQVNADRISCIFFSSTITTVTMQTIFARWEAIVIALLLVSVCLSVGHSVLLSLSVYLSLLSVHMCIRAHGVCRRRPSYSHAHLFIHDLLASYGVAEHRAEQWSFKYGGGLGRDTPVGSYITILPQNLIRIHKLSNTLCMYCKRSMCLFICGSLQASSNTWGHPSVWLELCFNTWISRQYVAGACCEWV